MLYSILPVAFGIIFMVSAIAMIKLWESLVRYEGEGKVNLETRYF